MKRNESYLKARMEREVPISVIVEQCLSLQGKTEQEQDELREQYAKEILSKYPAKEKKKRPSLDSRSGERL